MLKKKNTNCRESPINFSKIIDDHSCAFLTIHVEKEKTQIAENHPLISQKLLMIIRAHF